jgi:putative PIN family toxin of toxin-antitoxin system
MRARAEDVLALSAAVEAELIEVLHRPKFAGSMTAARRDRVIGLVRDAAVRFQPRITVKDCRDAKDNKYLELALVAGATIVVSSDDDLLVLNPWRGVRILRPAEYLALD